MSAEGRLTVVVISAEVVRGSCQPLPTIITSHNHGSQSLKSEMRRTAKAHYHFVGTVLCECFTYLVPIAGVASLHTDRVSVGVCVRHGRDHNAIAVNVDTRRGRPVPGEVNRVHALHLITNGTEHDHRRWSRS